MFINGFNVDSDSPMEEIPPEILAHLTKRVQEMELSMQFEEEKQLKTLKIKPNNFEKSEFVELRRDLFKLLVLDNSCDWERILFWLERLDISERISKFQKVIKEELMNKIQYDGKESLYEVLFKHWFIQIENFSDMVRALVFCSCDFNIFTADYLKNNSNHTNMQVMQPFIIMIQQFKKMKPKRSVLSALSCFHLMCLKVKSEYEKDKTTGEIFVFEKKKKLKSSLLRIDDEQFIPAKCCDDLKIDLSDSNILQTMKIISLDKDRFVEILRNEINLSKLAELSLENIEDVCEILANCIAHSHHSPDLLKDNVNDIKTITREMKGMFDGITTPCIHKKQILRLLANFTFSSDEFGCNMERVLPLLRDLIKAPDNISAEILRTIACFASVPNLRKSMYCLGFSHFLTQIHTDPVISKQSPTLYDMTATALGWLESLEKERIFFKSCLIPKLSNGERKSMFSTSSVFTSVHPQPVEPNLYQKIQLLGFVQATERKFVISAPDGYGLFKMLRTERAGRNILFINYLIQGSTMRIREVISEVFPNESLCNEYCMKIFENQTETKYMPYQFDFKDQFYIPFTTCSDEVGKAILHHSHIATKKFRKMTTYERRGIDCYRKIFKMKNLGKSKEGSSDFNESFISLLANNLKQSEEVEYGYPFYRDLYGTLFCHQFYLSTGEQKDFGFQSIYNTKIKVHLGSDFDNIPTPNLESMEWITNMASLVDNTDKAKNYITKIYLYLSIFFMSYGRKSIAANIFFKLQKWKEGKIRAIDIPFIRALLDRTQYLSGSGIVTDKTLVESYKSYGFVESISLLLEKTRSAIPFIEFPRGDALQEISKQIAKNLVKRKLAGKSVPKNLNKELIPVIASHREMSERGATLMLKVVHDKFLTFLGAVWQNLSQKDIKEGNSEIYEYSQKYEREELDKFKGSLADKFAQLYEQEGMSQSNQQDNYAKAMKVKCASCGKLDATKRCGKCKSVYYCSTQCQNFDWKTHKHTCNKH